VPLRNHAERALSDYFTSLNGRGLPIVRVWCLREVEEPLFASLLDYAQGNPEVRAAGHSPASTAARLA